jgi:hypothetical protein
MKMVKAKKRHQAQLAKHQQQEEQPLGPIQVETVNEEMGANSEPTMVTDFILVDPNKKMVLPSLCTF